MDGDRLFVGGQDHIDCRVTVGVNADLEARLVDLCRHLFQLRRFSGTDAVIVSASLIRLRKLSGPSGDGAVGDEFDSANAQHLIPKAGAQSDCLQSVKVLMPHQHIDP